MAQKVNIFSNEWCDIVFENRNKDYGAFSLRRLSNNRHSIALIIAILFFLIGTTAPVIIKKIVPERKERDVSVRTLSDINLDKPKEKVDEMLKELPPPPPLKNVIKFTAPVIKPDEEVAEEEEPKTQAEVVESKAAIGNIDFDKGTDDPTAAMPDEMPTEDQQIVGEEGQVFLMAEQMPEFPGGEREMLNYLNSNIKYPQMARESGIQGTVFVKFVVEKNGSVSNVEILRGIGGGCDEEALRVIKNMPKWNPGKQNGLAVRVYFNIPMKFRLN
jgi:periplasmic protein TonB